MVSRLFGGFILAAASLVAGYFGFQVYLKWLLSGQSDQPG